MGMENTYITMGTIMKGSGEMIKNKVMESTTTNRKTKSMKDNGLMEPKKGKEYINGRTVTGTKEDSLMISKVEVG